jgi:hypothetical protein
MGWNAGEATSVRNSNAVFSASAVHTDTIANTIQHHSAAVNPTVNPNTITATVAAAWIQALCWDFSMIRMPWIAQFTLRKRPVNVSDCGSISYVLQSCALASTQRALQQRPILP